MESLVKRSVLGVVALALSAAPLAFGGGERSSSAQAAAKPRPNILVLETDDQTVEDMRALTSVRRLLGAEGTTFDNSFVSYSLCCPSRSTLLTGQYAHNHGVLGNKPPEGGYYKLDGTNTLAVWLQRAGYHTAHLGKYLNGYGARNPTEVPPGWSEWHGTIDPSTYNYYGYRFNENGTVVPSAGSGPAAYLTDVESAKAQEIIGRLAPAPQPFFLWVAFLAPHSGGPREPGDPPTIGTPVPAPRHKGSFASLPLPTPPSFNEADVSDKPAGMRSRPLLGPARVEAVTASYRQRLESLLAVDEAIASIVARLKATGELENTLIAFTSDNGFFHGEHRVPAGKVLLYEPSIRVPLILRGPGVPRGKRLSQPVANIDLAPTFVEASGARPGRTMDEPSLFALLRDPGRQWGRDLLLERGPGGRADAVFSAVRTPRFLYAEYSGGDKELYDLAVDPDELASKHADPAYAGLRDELARRLAVLRTCKGSVCRQGPRLVLELRRCGQGRLLARVSGADTRAPFVQSRVALRDGRLVTLDRAPRAC